MSNWTDVQLKASDEDLCGPNLNTSPMTNPIGYVHIADMSTIYCADTVVEKVIELGILFDSEGSNLRVRRFDIERNKAMNCFKNLMKIT